MKTGFQIEIQKDLTEKEVETAKKFANEFITKTCGNNMVFYLGGKTAGYRSYLRRGRFGYLINEDKEFGLVFRRASWNKRIFGIFKYTELLDKETNEPPRIKMCMCPKHRGGLKVKWKTEKPESFTYAMVGDVKG